jgi:hypothetical protein
MGIGHAGDLITAARIEKMQDREGGAAFGVHAAETVPKGASGDRGDMESRLMNLTVEFVQAVDSQLGKRIGIDFRAAIGSGVYAIGKLRAVTLHLPPAGVEQQSAHGRAAYIDTDDKGVGGGAHGDFPL